MGESYEHALQMAHAGGTAGKFKDELIFDDCGASQAKAALAAQKLITADHVNCLISMCDAYGNVIAPLAKKASVVHFCYGTSASVPDGQFNFVLNAMPDDEARVFTA